MQSYGESQLNPGFLNCILFFNIQPVITQYIALQVSLSNKDLRWNIPIALLNTNKWYNQSAQECIHAEYSLVLTDCTTNL